MPIPWVWEGRCPVNCSGTCFCGKGRSAGTATAPPHDSGEEHLVSCCKQPFPKGMGGALGPIRHLRIRHWRIWIFSLVEKKLRPMELAIDVEQFSCIPAPSQPISAVSWTSFHHPSGPGLNHQRTAAPLYLDTWTQGSAEPGVGCCFLLKLEY